MPIGVVSQKEMYETAIDEPDWVDDAQKIEELAQKIRSSEDTKYDIKAFELNRLKKDVEFDLETLSEIRDLIYKLTWKNDDKLLRLQNLLDSRRKL